MSGIFCLLIPWNSFDLIPRVYAHIIKKKNKFYALFCSLGQEIILMNEQNIRVIMKKKGWYGIICGQCWTIQSLILLCVFQEVRKVLWYFCKGCADFGPWCTYKLAFLTCIVFDRTNFRTMFCLGWPVHCYSLDMHLNCILGIFYWFFVFNELNRMV